MPKTSQILIAIMLVSCTAFAVDARKKELTEPTPITITEALETETIKDAIYGALIQRGWVTESINKQQQFDTIDAVLYVRTHKIMIQLSYDSKQVSFAYLDSENMKYKAKRNKQYIHPNYMVWTQQLADQIQTNLDLGDAYDLNQHANQASNTSNPPPKHALNQFQNFKLEPTALAPAYMGNKGNESTMTNLTHNLDLQLQPVLDQWSQDDGSRTLIIKPHIQAVRFIGTGARIWAGSLAGRSWILVKLNLIDEASGEVIAAPELYRLARLGNGFSGSRRDYKMIEDIAVDIKNYMVNNYSKALGGGRYPPAEIKQEIKTQ